MASRPEWSGEWSAVGADDVATGTGVDETLSIGGGGAGRPWTTPITALLGLAVLVVAVLTTTNHPAGRAVRGSSHAAVVSPRPGPRSVPGTCAPSACPDTSKPDASKPVTGWPSPAIVALFAQRLPGAIVISERSVTARMHGVRALERRVLHVVTGNVLVTVTIRPVAAAARPAGARARLRFDARGYEITFGLAGYYAPTAAQLRPIAVDRRLTALG